MPKKRYSLKSVADERTVNIIDTEKLILPLVLGVGLAGVLALVLLMPMLREGSLVGHYWQYYLVSLWCILFIPSLATVTYLKYGTKQLYCCGVLLRLIESDFKWKKPLANKLFGCIKWVYSILGSYTSSEEVDGFCYAMERYQEFIGQGKSGLIAQRVGAISNKNFYTISSDAKTDSPHYATMRRLFIESAERGSKLFHTKEHKYFERGE
jgi:hypothetical protein